MKLRNKKTGEIIEYDEEVIYYRKLTPKGHDDWTPHHPEDWEDYKPAKPLIKDHKILKAVRIWAEVNDFEPDCEIRYYSNTFSLFNWQASIEFNIPIEGLENNEKYTITELCGEEEE